MNVNAPTNGGSYACLSVDNENVNLSIFNIYFKPEIIATLTDIDTTIQEDVILTCDAEAFPFPSLQWQKEASDGSFELLDGESASQLVLPKLSFSDSGTYRCIASNTINGTMYTTQLDFSVTGNFAWLSSNNFHASLFFTCLLQCVLFHQTALFPLIKGSTWWSTARLSTLHAMLLEDLTTLSCG